MFLITDKSCVLPFKKVKQKNTFIYFMLAKMNLDPTTVNCLSISFLLTLILQYEVYKIKRDLNNLVGNHSSCQCDVKSCNDRKSEK